MTGKSGKSFRRSGLEAWAEGKVGEELCKASEQLLREVNGGDRQKKSKERAIFVEKRSQEDLNALC